MRQRWVALASVGLAASLAVTACGSSSGGKSSGSGGGGSAKSAKTAQSAAAGGGMAALVAAAKKEGTLNLIAVPPTWAGYGAIIDGFTAQVRHQDQQREPGRLERRRDQRAEVDQGPGQRARTSSTSATPTRSPARRTGCFAPYKVATWSRHPGRPEGLRWPLVQRLRRLHLDRLQRHQGRRHCPTTIKELDNPAYKGDVALNGDPTSANAAFEAVWAAALANGGSADQHPARHRLLQEAELRGHLQQDEGHAGDGASGATPIVLDWDYLNVGNAATLKKAGRHLDDRRTRPTAWSPAYYAQAISINAAHPAAARLWEEYLYSQDADGGQNGWLRGFARPIELPAMQKNGTADKPRAGRAADGDRHQPVQPDAGTRSRRPRPS